MWRSKKMTKEAGRQTQICVWTPEREAELTREICTRVAEPSERGSALRSVLRQQLNRRRTVYDQWLGGEWKLEIDGPFVGPWWYMRHIGGRVLGPRGTHIELSPEEAEALKKHMSRVCEKEIKTWVGERKLTRIRRDDTGVVIKPHQYSPSGDKNSADAPRPEDDAAFAINEAKIARAVLEAARQDRKPPFEDPSVIEYEGVSGFPSFCQIAHRKRQGRIQFALIHMTDGGTSPTNMVESLATLLRHEFYPKLDPALIDWFDVIPTDTYLARNELSIDSVVMQHANGVYSDPEWSAFDMNSNQDWVAFVEETIARGHKTRNLTETAPHD